MISNELDIMLQTSLKAIPRLQHIMNVMHHIIGLEVLSTIKLLIYRVDGMIWVIRLSSSTPVSYLTTSLRGDK